MAKKRITDLTDEELAQKEEEQNLAVIEKKIDSVIGVDYAFIAELNQQIADMTFIIDKDDQQNYIYLTRSRESRLKSVKQWDSYKDSPYFGRMDMVRGGSETEVFFVGEKSIVIDGKAIVLDWRSPVGETFYNKQATRFTIKSDKYKLLLRRAVNIKNAKVIAVHTEFDDVSLSLDGEVIDPFLLSVLRDKRRNYKLTDIIRTIQGNQNELIRKPLDESFIVQGCAGSGKTMILLHRMSYIAFNHPDFDFSRCCILTPNEYFNIHVDELSQKLGLDKIKRYTVEAFYASWIRFLGKNDTYTNSTQRKVLMKVEPVPETVLSEKLLNSEMLEEVYSRRFFQSIIALYEKHWEQVFAQLESTNIKAILRENGKSFPDNLTYSYSSYNGLKKSISDIITKHSSAIKEYEKAQKTVKSAEKQINALSKTLDGVSRDLDNKKTTFLSDLSDLENELSASLQSIKDAQNEATQIIKKAKADKTSKFTELKTVEEALERIKTDRDNLKKPAFLRTTESEITSIILGKCTNEIRSFEEAEAEYKSVPFYNFGKRNRARTNMEEAAAMMSRLIDEIVDEYTVEHSSKREILRGEIADLDAVITKANKKLAASGVDKISERKLKTIRKCRSLFYSETLPDVKGKMTYDELADLPDSCNPYSDLLYSFRENEKLLHAAERQRNESKEIIEKNERSIILPESIKTLKDAMHLVEQLDYLVLNAKLNVELEKVYTKYGQVIRKDVYYRHGLLYKLLLCSLYYEYRTDVKYFINIDEAQDLAETEYVLLRRILGPKTNFNLYGDVNQLVYSYKGITQWDEIADVITNNLYFLNENYRNTLQITDFCNKQFEADITGIGLAGEEVKKLPFNKAIAELNRIKKAMPDCRAAVIYRKGLNKISEALAGHESSVVFDQVDEKKISVITVEESKGLEFDAVVVIESQMIDREKYISYTRALDNLIITELPGAEIEADNDPGGNDESPESPVETAQEDEPMNEFATDDIVPAGDMTIAAEEKKDEQVIRLSNGSANIRISDAAPYINAFFGDDVNSRYLFAKLLNSVSAITPDIMIRVSKKFIGFAKQNEKCRLYVAIENGKPFLKYKHLFTREDFVEDRFDHYVKAYQQGCQYIEKYPDSIKMKNGEL